jgi:hypothetical protein
VASEKQEITGERLVVANSGCGISNNLRKVGVLIYKELRWVMAPVMESKQEIFGGIQEAFFC